MQVRELCEGASSPDSSPHPPLAFSSCLPSLGIPGRVAEGFYARIAIRARR